jgi:hypothetical protein
LRIILSSTCYIHGDPTIGIGHRGIDLNASNSAVIDSYLSKFKQANVNLQAFAIQIWNGWGPFFRGFP